MRYPVKDYINHMRYPVKEDEQPPTSKKKTYSGEVRVEYMHPTHEFS